MVKVMIDKIGKTNKSRALMAAVFLIVFIMVFIGAGKSNDNKPAPEETKTTEGFKLSPSAIHTLQLRSERISGDLKVITVPTSSLVHFQDEVGIYRLRNGFYKLLEVEIQNSTSGKSTLKTNELKLGDEIIVQGVPLLRVVDLHLSGGPVDVD